MSGFLQRGGVYLRLHGRARLTKAIKRTLLSILEQASAAHYLAAQLISKAVHNAQQSSKWNSLIWYSYNTAIRCRYGCMSMEYLPLNGNAFDSSVSEPHRLKARLCIQGIGVFIGVSLSLPPPWTFSCNHLASPGPPVTESVTSASKTALQEPLCWRKGKNSPLRFRADVSWDLWEKPES